MSPHKSLQGSKPEVSKFATEFIKRKHEAKHGVRQQSTATAAAAVSAASSSKQGGSKGGRKR